MSGRGGRGSRGGRGGRGGGAPIPVARDDEGKVIATQPIEGPPPLFPEIAEGVPELPDEIPTQTERQLIWRHELTHMWRHSQYHLQGEGDAAGANKRRRADYVESYQDVAAEEASGSGDGNLSRCTITMTLVPKYFPEELYTRQKRSAKASVAEKAYWASESQRRAAARTAANDDLALGKLDELAKREDRGGPGGKSPGGKPGGGGAGEEEEAPPEDIEEEEDDVPEDDDYYQNEQFDDDEGYLDDYDDGGGGDDAYF